jgi:hypothetical protein
MEHPADPYRGYESEARSNRLGAARLICALLAAISGGFGGVMLWIPMSIVAPFWVTLSLPQVLGALFASSMAYLVAGPAKASLARTMAFSLVPAAVCAAANIVLYVMIVDSYPTPPGGQATLTLEPY